MKHHTSKFQKLADLPEINTFGFRGEALSSLCALSKLSIVTRHSSHEHGFKLEFDHNGVLVRRGPFARETGTTVYVRNIFKNLPVRAKQFQKNLKKEYTRAIHVLYSYCLVCTRVKITCTNSIEGKSPNLIISTKNTGNVLDNINFVFDKKSVDGIVKLELEPPNEVILQEYNLSKNVTINFEWECYVSSCDHAVGRSSPDRQFFYINGRPCELTRVGKLINNVYHQYNVKKYPFVFLNINLDGQFADVNVTPDKRTIFLTEERLILATLKSSLTIKWSKLQGNFTAKTLTELNSSFKRTISPSYAHPPAKKLHTSPSVSCVKDNETILADTTKKSMDAEMVINVTTIREKLREERNIVVDTSVGAAKRIKYKAQMETDQSEAEKELQMQLTKDSFSKVGINLCNVMRKEDTRRRTI